MRSSPVRLGVAIAWLVFGASCAADAAADDGPREIEIVIAPVSPSAPSVDPVPAASTPDTDPPGTNPGPTTPTAGTSTAGTSTAGSARTASPSTTPSTPPSTTSSTSTSSVPTAVSATPSQERWRIGLVDQEPDQPAGSQPPSTSYQAGFRAALDWANTGGHVTGDRILELVPCRAHDEATAVSCAETLVAAGVDVVASGYGDHAGAAFAVVSAAGVPVIGGVASTTAVATSPVALTHLGGPVAEHAALASAVVGRGFGATVIVHDDTAPGRLLVAELIVPVLDAAGVSHIEIAVPPASLDARGEVGAAAGWTADSWIVVTSASSCEAVVRARAELGGAGQAFYAAACTRGATLAAVGELMAGSWFVTELVDPTWFDVVPPDLREGYGLATAVLDDLAPTLVGDPLALAGYAAGTALAGQLRRTGPDPHAARGTRVPHPLGVGELWCDRSVRYPGLCSADLLIARWDGAGLVAPPERIDAAAS